MFITNLVKSKSGAFQGRFAHESQWYCCQCITMHINPSIRIKFHVSSWQSLYRCKLGWDLLPLVCLVTRNPQRRKMPVKTSPSARSSKELYYMDLHPPWSKLGKAESMSRALLDSCMLEPTPTRSSQRKCELSSFALNWWILVPYGRSYYTVWQSG